MENKNCKHSYSGDQFLVPTVHTQDLLAIVQEETRSSGRSGVTVFGTIMLPDENQEDLNSIAYDRFLLNSF